MNGSDRRSRQAALPPARPVQAAIAERKQIQALLGEARKKRRAQLCQTHQQTVWELPDASRVPVAKHPGFGRYFWVLFEAVTGRDLMTSFDRPRATSSPAQAAKPVAASTAAAIPKDPKSDFALIVEPSLGCRNAIASIAAAIPPHSVMFSRNVSNAGMPGVPLQADMR